MSSDEEDIDDVEAGEAVAGGAAAGGSKSKGLALRIQKKFLGMSVKSKGAAKNLNIIGDKEGLTFVHVLYVCTSSRCRSVF